ncbi:hypothetical protein AGLY_000315 [Aphis glycines]|uniref:Uncharacterized protein n=1 Tax=Aphis glycines TaxID=307491 RepID=A0A6G0U749_APHGL|nr:hypothetical protein AGLY_000315 [Aphis glycines]
MTGGNDRLSFFNDLLLNKTRRKFKTTPSLLHPPITCNKPSNTTTPIIKRRVTRGILCCTLGAMWITIICYRSDKFESNNRYKQNFFYDFSTSNLLANFRDFDIFLRQPFLKRLLIVGAGCQMLSYQEIIQLITTESYFWKTNRLSRLMANAHVPLIQAKNLFYYPIHILPNELHIQIPATHQYNLVMSISKLICHQFIESNCKRFAAANKTLRKSQKLNFFQHTCVKIEGLLTLQPCFYPSQMSLVPSAHLDHMIPMLNFPSLFLDEYTFQEYVISFYNCLNCMSNDGQRYCIKMT